MIASVSLIFFFVMLIIFFISARLFFALSIVARAMANLLVGVKIFSIGGSIITFPDILAIYTLLFGFIYLLNKWPMLMVIDSARPIILSLLLFIFFTGLAAMVDGLDGIIEAAKVTSWLLYLPLGFVLFSDREGIKLLKKSGIVAALVIIIGLAVGNIQRTGDSAYDLGILYLGLFTSEASVSTALLASFSFFFLPSLSEKSIWLHKLFHKTCMLLIICLIVLVMLRSAILSVFIFIIVYNMFSGSAGFVRTAATTVGIFILFVVIVTGVILSNPESVDVRFKDVKEYQAGGEATNLGSGRLSLLVDYFKDYKSQSLVAQIFGTDFYTNTGQSKFNAYKSRKFGTHNDVMQVLFLSGLLGLLFYVSFWVSIANALRRSLNLTLKEHQRKITSLGVALLCVYGIFIFHGGIYYIYFMQSLAVIIGAALGNSFLTHQVHEEVSSMSGGNSNGKTKSFIY